MITRRFVLTGFVATAGVATASQYIPAAISEPQLYATVYGIGWDLEVIEHHIYEPMSVAYFGGTPAIDKFREVTAFVHAFPVAQEPMPTRWEGWKPDPVKDPLDRFRWNATFGPPFLNKEGGEWDGKSVKYWTVDMEERVRLCKDENDIWYFNRAIKDDEAVGGNNRNDRGTPNLIDEHHQQHFDDMHDWQKKWQAKYPETGMPPNDSPEWDEFWNDRAKMNEPTGRKLIFKAAFE